MEAVIATSLHLRHVEEDLVVQLKLRAARNGRSSEAEHLEILRTALAGESNESFDTLAEEFRRVTAGRSATPAETLLREGREER
jgi:plasmid stability protein